VGYGIGARLTEVVRTLSPGYFALVMATGILSIGLRYEELTIASVVLLVIAAVAYLVLVALSVWRLIAYPRQVGHDFAAPHTGFFFYTFVAGTDVLAARLAMDTGPALPTALLGVSFLVWLVLGYAVPWAVVIGRQGRQTLSGMDGSWFVWAVASQSIAVLAATLEPGLPPLRDALSIVAVMFWGVGLILYAIIGVAVIVHLLAHGVTPESIGPAYWVSMGAASITVLAGSRIVEMQHTPMVDVTHGLVAGGSVVLWSFATWLIPVLVAVDWWRHVVRRVPLYYDPSLWSAVFPLGMYAVAGIDLAAADRLPLVGWFGRVFLWIALAAWAALTAANVGHAVRRFATPR
jgi:tellurite resistance protein TehA-like permease